MSNRRVIGIDLGTTLTKVAQIGANGFPETIPNAEGNLATPSAILFRDDAIVVGQEAKLAALVEPGRVVTCIKRQIGNKEFLWEWRGKKYTPEALSAMILKKVVRDAEMKVGKVDACVITVPAYFDDSRRKATQDAGRIAGLEVLDIINEPTAAALAYGIHGDVGSQTIMVYDLGGGTFDVTIVRFNGYEVRVLATDGDIRLGGKDWDERLVKFAAGKFMTEHGHDPREDQCAYQELVIRAEEAKKSLSQNNAVNLSISANGKHTSVEITRGQFEKLTSDLLTRSEATCRLVLDESHLKWGDLDRVFLVGGSSHMPMVHKMINSFTSQWAEDQLPSDETVAHGAAIHASLLEHRSNSKSSGEAFARTARNENTFVPKLDAPNQPGIKSSIPVWMLKSKVTNVNSHSLGVQAVSSKTGQPINAILIPKNTSLPFTAKKQFLTSKAGQSFIDVKVLEGEAENPNVCLLIGQCRVSAIPQDTPKGSPIEVAYTYEQNGRLTVRARLPGSGIDATVTFFRDLCMQEEQVNAAQQAVSELNIK